MGSKRRGYDRQLKVEAVRLIIEKCNRATKGLWLGYPRQSFLSLEKVINFKPGGCF